MHVTPGSRLGPYEILAPIGAGGMGEVWKARDTRLDRSVAVKILPAALAQNAQLRLRFEREARTISQLHHPNICTLFDVGDDFLVMEYLEGESLADRLTRGPLPLAEVLRVGVQIAHALDKAHRAGIVHRDLKPGNIMLTKSGAKLLDFGLARAAEPAPSLTAVTEQKPLTQEGTILGTYQYMAPEQLAAEEADARSDIFAFGAVLYEMLTGARAFEGKTKTSLIAAIIGGEPRPLSQLQPLTPPALEHVITKCLAKERDERWQSAADIAGELEWIARSSFGDVAAPVAKKGRSRRLIVNAALAIAIGTAILLGVIAVRLWWRVAAAEQPVRAELLLPQSAIRGTVVRGATVLSPDGTCLAAVIGPRGRSMILIRDIRSGTDRVLAGTEGATFPFWSPDGTEIGFFAGQKLRKIASLGGPVEILADAQQGRGGSWGANGVIVFAPNLVGPLFRISEAGGAVTAVTKPGKGWTHRNPVFLPDGRTFLFTARDNDAMPVADLHAGSVEGSLDKRIVVGASNAAFDRGRIFFVRNGNLVSQQFDAKALAATGVPTAVCDQVEYYNARDLGNFSVAAGRLIYVSAQSDPRQIAIYDRSARAVDVKGEPGQYRVLDLSSDGTRLAVLVGIGPADVWVMQLDRGVLSRVTFTNSLLVTAAFSPDGKEIATATSTLGQHSTIVIHSLETTSSRDVVELPRAVQINGWSPDGKYLIGQIQSLETAHDVGYLALDHPQQFVSIVHGPSEEIMPSLSPDGKWLMYTSLESGLPQVYVTSFPSGEGKWQVTANGATAGRWTRDGKQIMFVTSGTSNLNVVDVQFDPTPRFGTPVPQPLMVAEPSDLLHSYLPTPAGNIITTKMAGEAQPQPIHLILNWPRLLPAS